MHTLVAVLKQLKYLCLLFTNIKILSILENLLWTYKIRYTLAEVRNIVNDLLVSIRRENTIIQVK